VPPEEESLVGLSELSGKGVPLLKFFVREALTNRRLMAHCAFDSRVTEWTGN